MRMRNKFIALLLVFVFLFALVSCGKKDGTVVQPTDPVYKKGEVVELNVYNWGEYISDGSEGSYNTNAEFEAYFNEYLSAKYNGVTVKVNYSTYPTNEDMYSKLKNSASSYDVIIPSDYMIERLIAENMLYTYDIVNDPIMTNYQYVMDEFKNAYYDPYNQYSVPYTYGMVGIIYNKAMVDPEDVDEESERSWGLLWNPKYEGNILQFNNPRDAFATAMFWKGLNINSTEEEDWDAALELLKEQKPVLQGYVSDEIFDKMRGESAAIAPYYVGDFLTMAESQENLDFFFPTEGTNYFVDAMCIPISTKHPSIAKEYINFMLSKEAAIANAEYLGYASPHSHVVNDPEYKAYMEDYAYTGQNGETAYDLLYNNSPDVVNAKYNALYANIDDPACFRNFTPEIQARVNTLWEDLKISGSTELWVHVTSIAIVVGVVAFAAYSIYTKKKRSRFYRERDKIKAFTKKKDVEKK